MNKKLLYLLLMIIASFGLTGCGEDNDGGGGSSSQAGQSSGVNEGLQEIQGTVRVNSLGAKDYVARLYDLQTNKFTDTRTDEYGNFSISNNLLTVDFTYAIHILDRRNRRIGILDFSSDAGLQGAITYGGGLGFDLGFIDITTSNFGLVTSYDFQISLSGDFSINNSYSGDLTESGLPSFVSSVGFGRELMIGNSTDMYNMFVKRASNPKQYSEGLAKYGGAFISVIPTAGEQIASFHSGRVYDWFLYSSYRSNPFDDVESGISWSKDGYNLSPIDGEIDYSISTNSSNIAGGYYSFGFRNANATYSELNRFLGATVVRPPLLSSVDLGDGVFVAINAANNHNGLLNLFQLAGTDNLVIDVIRPAYAEQIGVSETTVLDFDSIGVVFEYYNGSTLVEIAENDFGVVYYTDQTSLALPKTSENYSWDISKNELQRTTAIDNLDASCTNTSELDCIDRIEIPRTLFLELNTNINRVKVSIKYKGTTVRSGSSFWFEI